MVSRRSPLNAWVLPSFLTGPRACAERPFYLHTLSRQICRSGRLASYFRTLDTVLRRWRCRSEDEGTMPVASTARRSYFSSLRGFRALYVLLQRAYRAESIAKCGGHTSSASAVRSQNLSQTALFVDETKDAHAESVDEAITMTAVGANFGAGSRIENPLGVGWGR